MTIKEIYGNITSVKGVLFMLVSFEVENYGPFSGSVGISTQADITKKELLEKNTFLDGDQRYNYVNLIYG